MRQKIDSLVVEWPEEKRQVISNIDVDKTITVSYKNAVNERIVSLPVEKPVFTEVSSKVGIKLRNRKKVDFIDYTIQPTMPHKL